MINMSKHTTTIVIVSIICNFCLTFVWCGASILLVLNWLFPFALTISCVIFTSKIKKSQSIINNSNIRLEVIKEAIDK